jgi:glycosyltransferase involved in cell wall biosynthesis
MRIAIDTNALFTGQAGVARSVRGLLTGLARLPQRLDFFTLAWEVENLEYRQPARALKTFYRELVWAKTVAPRRLTRQHADLYHANGSYFVSVPRGIRRVVTLNDLAMLRHPERFRKWQRWSETRRLARLRTVDLVICISQFTADEAMRLLHLPSRMLEVVYLGHELRLENGVAAEQKPEFEVPDEFFLFVGSLEPGKNLALLKETYRLAAAEHKLLPPLLIVGARWSGVGTEGQPPADWQYLGRQPDEVLAFLYRRALALVFPSKYEGFGLPVIEAMALNCPVICSPVASLPEVGGDAACYADLQPQSYLEKMRLLAHDTPLRRSLSERGLVHARSFSWERCAEQTVEVYRKTMNGG